MTVEYTTLRLEVTPTDFITFARCGGCAALLADNAPDRKVHTQFHRDFLSLESVANDGWRQGDDR